MEGIGAGVDEGHQDGGELVGGVGDAGVVVGGLPLGQPQHDREAGGDLGADGGDDLGGEAGAGLEVAAVGVGAAVGGRPEELVDEVAVGAVELDAVETEALGGGRRGGERLDDGVDVLQRHLPARARGAVQSQSGGADGGGVGVGRFAGVADHADVLELRHDQPARRVDGLDDPGPAGVRVLAVQARHLVVLPGRRVADVGAAGDDQPGAARRAAGEVRGDLLARHAVR